MPTTDWIQTGAAIASVAVALVIGGAAVLVARSANGISKNAVKVATEARDIARDAVGQARRQAILGSVPHLVAARPTAQGRPPTRLTVEVTNGGPTVAYGILASVAGATERSLDALDEASRSQSGRQVALLPGAKPLGLVIRSGRPMDFPWVHVRLEYVSPLGAHVRHDYLGPSSSQDMRYRLHLVTIDPQDGTEPVAFPIELGPFDDEVEPRTPLFVG